LKNLGQYLHFIHLLYICIFTLKLQYTHTHTHTHTFIYIHGCVCVCVYTHTHTHKVSNCNNQVVIHMVQKNNDYHTQSNTTQYHNVIS